MKKYVVVGNASHPAETTCTVPDQGTVIDVVKHFLPGGSMWREGDKVEIKVFCPGQEIPEEIARHVVRGDLKAAQSAACDLAELSADVFRKLRVINSDSLDHSVREDFVKKHTQIIVDLARKLQRSMEE